VDFGELAEVLGGFECDHASSLLLWAQKSPRRGGRDG
jgi:hypothetical protein